MKEPLPILKPSVKTMVGNFHNIGTMGCGCLFLGGWDYSWRMISLFKVETCEHFNLSSRMGSNLSHLAEVSEFLTPATSSNFWGLACPGHCGPPFGVLCCWLLGVCFSLLLGLLLTLWICGGSCFTLACQAYPPSSTDQGSNHSPSGLFA